MALIRILATLLLPTIATCQTSTTLVTATTTVTATESGACNDFVGACVVYGAEGAAPYTTTVYAGNSETSRTTVTPTTTVSIGAADTTADAASACRDFVGACVVYGSAAAGASYTTTVYNGNSLQTTLGNSGGYIGPGGSSDGYIGEASSLNMRIVIPLISLAVVNVGFFVWM
ncbi:uncharacterized protein MYCFIDRAFT_211264 [Pseudocercospora fijiensis CIRAD86]|uniref:Uncharacterized protein n=1 Tax=Pseudocercospora fijiensis (strain CIRAD86) TaxID=383855 RepID=M3B1E4_PSEFD|nr:uncharacterized protein MYCFIDRAFT_211264 [Pseudocercospora fijiensis CIRAD86]EME83178.1 hypothetical protein MYCFIDRAFT_211264 [Pseudocercospora fijiensis CIRAD86]